MAAPVPNNQTSNVQQDSTFWTASQPGASRSQQIATGISDIYGLGKAVYGVAGPLVSGISGFGENPLRGILSVGATYNNLQKQFPSTFTGPQQSPTMENLNYYGGAVSQYSNIGLSGVNAYSQFKDKNYAGGLQSLADVYTGLAPKFGVSGTVPGAVNAGISGVGLAQNLIQGNYLGAGVNAAQLYNQAIQGGLIGGGQVPEGAISGVTGAYNLYQGLQNKNYAQAGLGGLSIAGTIANNAETISGVLHPIVSNLVSTGATQVAAQTGTQIAAQTGTQVAAQTGAEAGAAGAEVAGTSTASILGTAATYIGAAYGAYNLVKLGLSGGDLRTSDTGRSAAGGAASGAAVGAVAGPYGAAIGAVAGAVYGTVVAGTGSSKGKYQAIRDKWRDAVAGNEQLGLFGKDYKGKLADGTEFDFGQDGSKLNLNHEDPLVRRGATLGDILASAQGATGSGRVALATLFAGAATSNAKTEADVDKNMAYFAQKFGIDKGVAQAALNKLKIDDKLSDAQYNYFSDNIKTSPLANSKDPNVRKLQPTEIVKVRELEKVQEKRVGKAEDFADENDTAKNVDFQVPGDPNTYRRNDDGKIIVVKEVHDDENGKGIAPNKDVKGVIQAASGATDADRQMIQSLLTDNVKTGPDNFTPEQAAALGRILGKSKVTYKDLTKVKVS